MLALSARELSAMAQNTRPWSLVRTRAGAGPLESVADELDDAEIAEYFVALIDTPQTLASQPARQKT
ncbi:hypothetical protein [Streptomyces zhihengii]|uniref:hypothetical protein n=1 Tax=Streptomyces zhihengii TaxID=1818004 RepID=UPI0033B86D39